jgi:NADPH-dependent glutamate synthase beta subunit-like oxidoreductase
MPRTLRGEVRDLRWFRANVPCLEACPVKTDAGRYVQLIAEGRFAEAYRVARAPNPIASICGRTCGAPCEDACRRGRVDEPVAIRPLKRFVTENYGPESLSAATLADVLRGAMGGGSTTPGHGEALLRRRAAAAAGRRVAVVGAGPAGLACAHDLALLGHDVTIFEAMPLPGGMMRYGIPSYRLPREVIDHQVAEIEGLGVRIEYGTPLTQEFGVAELRARGFDAVFLAIGAGQGRGVRIEGGELDGVVKAIDYLLNINRGYRVPVGKRVVVVGGGLVALDAARVAMRAILPGIAMAPEDEAAVAASALRVALDAAREVVRSGAAAVTVVSLESAAELPAARSVQGREEVDVAAGEGIAFLPSWGPRRILGTAGKVTGLEVVRCVHAFDDAGRFNPVFDDTTTRVLDADAVILAIGQGPDTSFLRPQDGVETTPAGTIKVDPVTLATTAPGIFSGGDGAFPPALLITAAQQGKVAARSIDTYLRGEPPTTSVLNVTIEQLPTETYHMTAGCETIARRIPIVPLDRRSGISEVEQAFSAADAQAQARRCLYCHTHPVYDGAACVLCGRCADVCPEHCIRFASLDALDVDPEQRRTLEATAGGGPVTVYLYDGDRCIRCGLCAVRCPTAAITMERFHFEENPTHE